MADRTERTIAVVTGGSKGLGRALVAGLLDDGWTVVTDARHADTLASTAATLVDEHAGGDVDRLVAIAGDQRDPAHVDELVTGPNGSADRTSSSSTPGTSGPARSPTSPTSTPTT